MGTGWAADWFGHSSCKALVHQTKKATEGKKKRKLYITQPSWLPNLPGLQPWCRYSWYLSKIHYEGWFLQSVSIGQRTPEGTTPQSKKWPAERERGPRSGQPRAVLALFTQIRILGQSKKKKKKSSHYKSFFSVGFAAGCFTGSHMQH